MINQDFQQEYETRILVFKVNDNTIYDCSSLVKYDLKMFKGTRKEFDTYYLELYFILYIEIITIIFQEGLVLTTQCSTCIFF